MAVLSLMVWNVEWMNDLFVPDGATPAFRADSEHPTHSPDTTVKQRREDLSGVLNALSPEVVVIVEGPSKPAELQLFFDTDVVGTWVTHLQTSAGQQQNIGIAVRIDTGKFIPSPVELLVWEDGSAFAPFLADTDNDDLKEQHKFERTPLYVEVRPADSATAFRVLGLHLKSKGIFTAYEWSRWWDLADANRKRILAQASQIRRRFIEKYLTGDGTKSIPLLVCGDVNDGPGLDASERRLLGSGIERLMGNVWRPSLCLGNALFDTLTDKQKAALDFSSLATTSFKDPIFNNVFQQEWIDHILYSVPGGVKWVSNAAIVREVNGEKIWTKFKHASDHRPVVCRLEL